VVVERILGCERVHTHTPKSAPFTTKPDLDKYRIFVYNAYDAWHYHILPKKVIMDMNWLISHFLSNFYIRTYAVREGIPKKGSHAAHATFFSGLIHLRKSNIL